MPAGHDISSADYEPMGVAFVTDDDDDIPGNVQVIIEDVYELSAPYSLELQSNALFFIQNTTAWQGFIAGQDSSGYFLELQV